MQLCIVTEHAQELESIGCTDEIIKLGIVGQGPRVFFDRSPVLQYDFRLLLQGKTKYPMVLLLPQHTLEKFLEAKLKELGVKVQRLRRVTSVRPGNGGVEIQFEDQSSVSTKYVVGADGSKSTVRCFPHHVQRHFPLNDGVGRFADRAISPSTTLPPSNRTTTRALLMSTTRECFPMRS